MEKIIVSACLLGECCKYNGGSNENEKVKAFLAERGAEGVAFCPEVSGGLPTPRIPSERRDGRVFSKDGKEVTEAFLKGARLVREAARAEGCRLAILKARSPSCGSGWIYDGSFSGTLIKGDGVAAELLKKEGLTILTEEQL